MTTTPDDHRVAAELALGAGQLLVSLREDLFAKGVDPAEIKDQGDLAAHNYLMERLATLRPEDAVLSEEGKDDLARLAAERTWIVDPVDGTREFSEQGRGDWAVHVALCVDHKATLGSVALPAQRQVLSATPASVLPPWDPSTPPRMLVSRTRPPEAATVVAEALGATLVPMGSAGAKAMAVVQGAAEIYAHSGGQYEWDSCAPVAVAAAAGLHVSRINGDELRYNQPDVYLPDLLICRRELAESALEALAAVV